MEIASRLGIEEYLTGTREYACPDSAHEYTPACEGCQHMLAYLTYFLTLARTTWGGPDFRPLCEKTSADLEKIMKGDAAKRSKVSALLLSILMKDYWWSQGVPGRTTAMAIYVQETLGVRLPENQTMSRVVARTCS